MPRMEMEIGIAVETITCRQHETSSAQGERECGNLFASIVPLDGPVWLSFFFYHGGTETRRDL